MIWGLVSNYYHHVDDLLARFPKYTRLHVTYNNMGFLKYLKEDLPGAIADYKKSIEMCPNHIR